MRIMMIIDVPEGDPEADASEDIAADALEGRSAAVLVASGWLADEDDPIEVALDLTEEL